jgi:hypothetical protein
MASREFMESGYPADACPATVPLGAGYRACGAICPSFRALGKLSLKIWSTNLEVNLYFQFKIYLILIHKGFSLPLHRLVIQFYKEDVINRSG